MTQIWRHRQLKDSSDLLQTVPSSRSAAAGPVDRAEAETSAVSGRNRSETTVPVHTHASTPVIMSTT